MSLDRVPRDNPSCASSLTIEDDPAGAFVRPARQEGPNMPHGRLSSWPAQFTALRIRWRAREPWP